MNNFKYTFDDYKRLLSRLNSLADENYKQFSKKLIPGTEQILGVRLPYLRSIAKEIAKGDFRGYFKQARDDTYEEIMLQGMVIGAAKSDFDEIWSYAERFVPKISSWSICDSFVSGLKITLKNKLKVYKLLEKKYIKSEKEFEVRFAVVMLMVYYIDDEYIDNLFEIFDNISHKGYYVKMAVAWAVSLCFIKQEKKTMDYLKNSSLDDWTYNKSLQKIIESKRINADMKKRIKNMKRRDS